MHLPPFPTLPFLPRWWLTHERHDAASVFTDEDEGVQKVELQDWLYSRGDCVKASGGVVAPASYITPPPGSPPLPSECTTMAAK